MGGRRCRSWKVVALIGNTFSFFLENNVHHLVHLHIWVTILVIYFEGWRSCKRCISLDLNFSFAFWLLIKYQISSVDSIFHPSLTVKRHEDIDTGMPTQGVLLLKSLCSLHSAVLKRRHLQEARPHFDNHFWDQACQCSKVVRKGPKWT